ncbi:hypothetical protein SNEBB_009167 [Seison nebaliae]|nr:hypothetical protein SNEBB_009167 [Seison nebaliae]
MKNLLSRTMIMYFIINLITGTVLSLVVIYVVKNWKLFARNVHLIFGQNRQSFFNENFTKVLILIAHPDDESMFFIPFIRSLIATRHLKELHLICFTNGSYDDDDLGKKRKMELKKAWHQLTRDCKEKKFNLDIIDDVVKDDPNDNWSSQLGLLQEIVVTYSRINSIKQIVSFDSNGVSGHYNHIALSRLLYRLHHLYSCYELRSIPLIRKYCLPINLIYLIFFTNLSGRKILISNEWSLKAKKILNFHSSQIHFVLIMTNNIFTPIDGESANDLTVVESLCVNCKENGKTVLLPTEIPFFRNVVVSSFACEECGNRNSDIIPVNDINYGIRYELTIQNVKDLKRRIVRSKTASIQLPEIEVEIPSNTGDGSVTVIEETNKMNDEETEKIQKIIDRLNSILSDEDAFDSLLFILNDESGQSFIESFSAPNIDSNIKRIEFSPNSENEQTKEVDPLTTDEVIEMENLCFNCNGRAVTRMKVTDIPSFKSVVLMSTECEDCGEKSNEIKSYSGIEEKGKRFELNILNKYDLNRSFLISSHASIHIPHLEFETLSGTLGGSITTIEGFIHKFKKQLSVRFPYTLVGSDTSEDKQTRSMEEFLKQVDKILGGESYPFKLIVDDPSGNSYIQNYYEPENDPEMKVTEYERNEEHNENEFD